MMEPNLEAYINCCAMFGIVCNAQTESKINNVAHFMIQNEAPPGLLMNLQFFVVIKVRCSNIIVLVR